jgi:hypothetical protein
MSVIHIPVAIVPANQGGDGAKKEMVLRIRKRILDYKGKRGSGRPTKVSGMVVVLLTDLYENPVSCNN